MILLGKSSKLLEQLFFRTALKEIIFFFGLFMEKLCTVIHLHLFGKQKAFSENYCSIKFGHFPRNRKKKCF